MKKTANKRTKFELTTNGKKVKRRVTKIQQKKKVRKKTVREKHGARPHSVSANLKKEIYKDAEHRCHFCGRRIVRIENGQVDHVRPKAMGGKNRRSNYLPICKKCNLLKHHSPHNEIRQMLRLGKWAMSEIRKGTQVGIHMANKYKGELEN